MDTNPGSFTWRKVKAGEVKDSFGVDVPPGSYASDVVDQHENAWCGCCYMVCAAQMLEDRARILNAKRFRMTRANDKVDLQSLLDHFREVRVAPSWNSCLGGFPEHVLECVKSGSCILLWTKGKIEIVGYPRSVHQIEDTSSVMWNKFRISDTMRVPERFVKTEILNRGPLVLEISADTILSADEDGVVKDLSSKNIDHAVTVVGWEGDKWIVRNSWGTKGLFPGNSPDDESCVGRGYNYCNAEKREWRSDPRDPGFVLLPMEAKSLHKKKSPFLSCEVFVD